MFVLQYDSFDVPTHGGKTEGFKVEMNEFTKTIKACCDARGEEWACNVKGRIEYYHDDLPSYDVVYHRSCSINFRTNRRIPYQYCPDAKKGNSGRPENPILRDAFLDTCTDFETHEEEQLPVHQLVGIMNDKSSHTELSSYNHRYMKKKLLEHYGDNITITEDNGRKNIATYNPKVSSILREYYCKPKDVNVELEKIQLIEAAAAILQSEIKEKVSTTKDFYPPPEELSREDCLHYLPPLLRLLLTKMFSGIDAELKTATIGNASFKQCDLGQLWHHCRLVLQCRCTNTFALDTCLILYIEWGSLHRIKNQ